MGESLYPEKATYLTQVSELASNGKWFAMMKLIPQDWTVFLKDIVLSLLSLFAQAGDFLSAVWQLAVLFINFTAALM